MKMKTAVLQEQGKPRTHAISLSRRLAPASPASNQVTSSSVSL